MMHSEQINELAAALAKAQGTIQGAVKGKINPAFKSKYADLASIWDACREQLSSNGLSIVQTFDATPEGSVSLTTTLLHTSGQWIVSVLPVRPVKNDPQGMGSAATYARRYALAAMVGVAPDDDDDGNAASTKAPAKKAAMHEPARDVAAVPPLELFNDRGEVEMIHNSIEEYLADLGSRTRNAAWWFDQNEHVVDYLEREFGGQTLPKWGRTVKKVCDQLRKVAGENPSAGPTGEPNTVMGSA